MRRRHGGMGLGLSIARGIIKLHKGRIWAESKGEGQGTSIFVQLPLSQ
jgi:signal transduction histidine kinase